MPQTRVEPYGKRVLRGTEGPISFLRYWGAIGDHYYFLTFVAPLLRKLEGRKRIYVADTYPRYGGVDPLMEVCEQNGLLDEVWQHPRRGGGPTLLPQEMSDQISCPKPNVEAYVPGIYYQQFCNGPGYKEYPIEWLREQARMEKRYLIPIWDRERLCRRFPELRKPYVTVQVDTFGKIRNNVIPFWVLPELQNAGIRVVVLKFPHDLNRERQFAILTPGAVVVTVAGSVDSIQVLANAQLHIGVESSQLLAAAIHYVPSFFFPYGGYTHFERDLALNEIWHPVDWRVNPRQFMETIKERLK